MALEKRPSIGIELNGVNDLFNSVSNIAESGYSFAFVSLAHPRFRREFVSGKAVNRPGPFTRSDLIFNATDWMQLVALKLSPWIDVDSPNSTVRCNSEKALDQEINYGLHLGIEAMIVPLRSANCINLSRILNNKIGTLSLSNEKMVQCVWVQVPMKAPEDECKMFLNSPIQNAAEPLDVDYTHDTWEWWNVMRSQTAFKKIFLALELSADLNEQEIVRWLGEPIQAVIIPTGLFLTNKKGFPVLSKPHQNFVRRIFRLSYKTRIVIKGLNRHSDIKLYHQYVDHLFKTPDPPDFLTIYAAGFEDYLQIPLQPLMDNLETHTYETFEKDPIKYKEYKKAMYMALLDMVPEEEKETKKVVLMVVGAGRGPLVRAALTAAQEANRLIKVYAVDKNPNAVVTLQTQQEEMWGDQVTVVSCDMREWDPPEKADILVSELLGSFGDNELSPECLDGAQKFLKEDGISIPSSYTSYLAPICSPKCYNAAVHNAYEEGKVILKNYEMPYVVRLHNCTNLSSPLPVFTFHHPNKDQPINNARYIVLTYKMPFNCTLHGFSGFFDTILYKDIKLSIHPETHSEGLCSWFPLYFPIKEPVYVRKDEDVELHFWRCVSNKDVWYEWLVAKPVLGTIHNPKGRSHKIGQ